MMQQLNVMLLEKMNETIENTIFELVLHSGSSTIKELKEKGYDIRVMRPDIVLFKDGEPIYGYSVSLEFGNRSIKVARKPLGKLYLNEKYYEEKTLTAVSE
jgi:hypothetical protein